MLSVPAGFWCGPEGDQAGVAERRRQDQIVQRARAAAVTEFGEDCLDKHKGRVAGEPKVAEVSGRRSCSAEEVV